MSEARRVLKDRVTYATRAMEAARDADAVLLVTEWNEFRSPNLDQLKGLMRQAIIFDGRNVMNPVEARRVGFEYRSIGRP
jgi:UDPglucose 6-dehydrogenase